MNANCSVDLDSEVRESFSELQTVFFFCLQREEWTKKTSSEKKKEKTEYTLSPIFSLYFSFMSVDHIDTLTALLLLESVDLRDSYYSFSCTPSYYRVLNPSGLAEMSQLTK